MWILYKMRYMFRYFFKYIIRDMTIQDRFILFLCLVAFLMSTLRFGYKVVSQSYGIKQKNLETQIREVEDTIENLRNLETYLEKTKSDIIATEQAKIKIEEEYNKAKELEHLTKNQIEAVSLAVNKRTTKDIITNYFWGFALGVSGLLFVSYIRGLAQRRKEKIK